MMVLVTGASGSGKSEYAEGVAVKLAGKGNLYYLATMRVYGEEGARRVERHRKLRAGKGFQTVECPVNVDEAFAQAYDRTISEAECQIGWKGMDARGLVGVHVKPCGECDVSRDCR